MLQFVQFPTHLSHITLLQPFWIKCERYIFLKNCVCSSLLCRLYFCCKCIMAILHYKIFYFGNMIIYNRITHSKITCLLLSKTSFHFQWIIQTIKIFSKCCFYNIVFPKEKKKKKISQCFRLSKWKPNTEYFGKKKTKFI